MSIATQKIPSADSTGAPYVAGNFAPLRSEVTCFDLEVIGKVPEELTGRFLRIGPNPLENMDQVRLVRHHWFAGTGMAHGLRLCRGKAEWFRSRFVLDRDAARVLSRKPLPGPSEGARDRSVNTNLMNVGGTTDRLMQLSRTMVGHFPGSLAQINVVLSIFFAGISGSSTADAAS